MESGTLYVRNLANTDWVAVLGTQGPQGYQGASGTAGTPGGPQGYQGYQGATGSRGTQGTQGYQGYQGYQGNQGYQGRTGVGVQGSQGYQGYQGHSGIGFQGPQGYQGRTGTQGFQGYQGYQGEFGGPQGYQGDQGYQGTPGTGSGGGHVIEDEGTPLPQRANLDFQGQNVWVFDDAIDTTQVIISGGGATGPQGYQGATGAEGAQGYQGHTGIGFQGYQGATGAQGTQGYQGATGVGAQGYQGSTGAQGTQGYQGHTGAQGTQGYQGDTGAQGYQGYQGVTGAQGYQGYQGHTGAQGFQGYQGYTGAQGSQGYQGHTGAQGFQGYQGHTGMGYQGYQGETGTPGAQGFQGYQGHTGAGVQGPQGDQGYQGNQGLAGTGSAHTIRDETTPLTQRTYLSFKGDTVWAVDNAGSDSTDIIISGSASQPAIISGTPNFIARFDGTGNQLESFIRTSGSDVHFANGRIYFGTGSDVVLYRYQDNMLMTDDDLFVLGYIMTTDNIYICHVGDKLLFGDNSGTYDVNLYRTADGHLITDNRMAGQPAINDDEFVTKAQISGSYSANVTGTPNFLAKFDATGNDIEDSIARQSGSVLVMGGPVDFDYQGVRKLYNKILTVSSNGGADYTNLATALSEATSGSCVLVYPGTYTPTVGQYFTVPANVGLMGIDRGTVILQATTSTRYALVLGGNNEISNFTLNGNAGGWTYYGIGWITGSAGSNITNVAISINCFDAVTHYGISLANCTSGTTKLRNCIVRMGQGSWGTTVTARGIDFDTGNGISNAEIVNCTVIMSFLDGVGIGVYIPHPDYAITYGRVPISSTIVLVQTNPNASSYAIYSASDCNSVGNVIVGNTYRVLRTEEWAIRGSTNYTDNTIFTLSSGTSKALIVRGVTGQTANIQEWQDGNSNILAFVNHSGILMSKQIGIGTNVPNYTLEVTGSNAILASFGAGRVIGGNAVNTNEFMTLGQYTGSAGPQGYQGATGSPGSQGYQGATGSPGSQGYQGATGTQGSQGYQGATGSQGSQGYQGATGSQGYQGYTGAQGFQGYQGYTGSPGPQGYQGHTGVGVQGYQGATGTQGFQGYQGHTGMGYQGYQGATGAQGYQGYQGATGVGVQGYQGVPGPSGSITSINVGARVYRSANFGVTGNADIFIPFTNTRWDTGGIFTSGTNPTRLTPGASGTYLIAGSIRFAQSHRGLRHIFVRLNGTTELDRLSIMPISGATTRMDITTVYNMGPTDYVELGVWQNESGSALLNVESNANSSPEFMIQIMNGQGPQGYQGYQGYTGTPGAQGYQGATGSQGAQGYQGATGTPGAQGYQGPTGSQGAQGYQGVSGGQGYQGYQGATGTQGAQGYQGVSGGQGYQGYQGYTGSPGPQGYQGHTGVGTQGYQGSTGAQGSQGYQGHTGMGFQGYQGATGTQGYQGYTGAQGYQGYQGHTGAQGYQGYQGNTGSQGYQGYQGHTGAQGFQGYQGYTGTPGAQGYQGHTGSQGSQGYQGATGTQGAQGYQGNTGSTGAQGYQGATGTQGSQGYQGATGSQGSQGYQGATGSQGSQGYQGATGTPGAQGYQGNTGSPGAQGYQGATGSQGAQGASGAGVTGTPFWIPRFSSDGNSLINSVIYQTGTSIFISGSTYLWKDVTFKTSSLGISWYSGTQSVADLFSNVPYSGVYIRPGLAVQGNIRAQNGLRVGTFTTNTPPYGAIIADDVIYGKTALIAGYETGTPSAGDLHISSDARIGGGLVVGSTIQNPAAGEINIWGPNGYIYWGNGTGNFDVSVSRQGNNILEFGNDDTIITARFASVYGIISGYKTGTLNQGDIHALADVRIGGGLTIGNTITDPPTGDVYLKSATPYVYFGSGSDVTLYRGDSGLLRTNSRLSGQRAINSAEFVTLEQVGHVTGTIAYTGTAYYFPRWTAGGTGFYPSAMHQDGGDLDITVNGGMDISGTVSIYGGYLYMGVANDVRIWRANTDVFITDDDFWFGADVRVAGGLVVGSTGTNPSDKELIVIGNASISGTTVFSDNIVTSNNPTAMFATGSIYIPFSYPLQSTLFDGDTYNTTTGNMQIDMSAAYSGSVGWNGIKAYYLQLSVRDFGGGHPTSDSYFGLAPRQNSSQRQVLRTPPSGAKYSSSSMVVSCDAAGDIWYYCSSISGTVVYMSIWGYFI